MLDQYMQHKLGKAHIPPVPVSPQREAGVVAPPPLSVVVPEKLESTYKTFAIMHDFCAVGQSGNNLCSSNSQEMTPEESTATARMLQKSCPVHA